METYILNIQKMSTEDGPGIRTTVFFKGCNLRCAWCHNPESIPFYRQLFWHKDKCMGCQSCINSCPKEALSFIEGELIVDDKKCDMCLICVEECPTNAIEVKGEKWEIEALVNEIMKDKAFYDNSGGGVTISGGEAVFHIDYVLPLLVELKNKGVHIALDTAGSYPYQFLQKLLPNVDLVLYDLKHFDNEKHKQFVGSENTLILQNAKKLGKLDYPKIWIRTPIIPESTDTVENIAAIGKFIKEFMPKIERWELISFNNLCKDKYKLLGREWKYADAPLIEKRKMENLTQVAKKYIKNAMWSGATKLEE